MSAAGTILLVEDDAADVLLLRRAFAKGGITHPVRVASDGEEAIAYLAGDGDYADRKQYPQPSIVLLDIKLPRASGFDVLLDQARVHVAAITRHHAVIIDARGGYLSRVRVGRERLSWKAVGRRGIRRSRREA